MRKPKNITLDSETIERIRDLGKMGEAYDNVINRIIDELHSVRNTRVIIGRKKTLADIFDKRLTARHSLYSVCCEELEATYRPFIPLLTTTVQQLGGSSKILTNINKQSINAIKQLALAGAEIRHLETRTITRCIIYDNSVVYFSALQKPFTRNAGLENIMDAEGPDMWTKSTEPDVIRHLREFFFCDWGNSKPLEERIKELDHHRDKGSR
jgi:hypothetical protein